MGNKTPSGQQQEQQAGTAAEAAAEGGQCVATAGKPAGRGWFRAPPRIWTLLIMVVVVGLLSYVRSFPPGMVAQPEMAYLLVPVGLLLLGDFLIRIGQAFARRDLGARRWRWYAALLLWALILWVWRSDWPLRIRFERSRAVFQAAAAELLQTGEALRPPTGRGLRPTFTHYHRRLGTYRISMVCVVPEQRVVYFVTGGFFRSGWGFVYNPDGQPLDFNVKRNPDDDWVTVRPFTEGWMTFMWATP